MPQCDKSQPYVLSLKAGEWVEVREREQILATLDEQGCLENMPFMQEMLEYCGKRYRVFKRADKTCQYIVGWSIRRVKNAAQGDFSGPASCRIQLRPDMVTDGRADRGRQVPNCQGFRTQLRVSCP